MREKGDPGQRTKNKTQRRTTTRKTQEKNPHLLGSDLHHHRPSSSYVSSFSNNITSNSLGKEDQGRRRKTELGEQASIQATAPNIFITIVDVLSRGSTEGRPRKAVDKSHHQRHNRFHRLQKQQLQSSIFSSHCTRNRAHQERNTRTNRGRKGGRREEEKEEAASFVQHSAPSSPATPCCTR